jgi:taurine dioxygenase
MVTGIVGMPEDEAIALRDELVAFATQPRFVYRHRWNEGDLVMWDNTSTQHLAIGDFALPQRRLMHRTTVAGTA